MRTSQWIVRAAGAACLLGFAGSVVLICGEELPVLRARKGTLARTTGPVPRSGGGTGVLITLHGSTGLRVECGMLLPPAGGTRYPAIIVLGGKATGKYAVDYALGIEDAVVIAVDYPYEPQASYTIPSFIGDVPAIRRALLDMVPSVMLVVDYLRHHPAVDSARITLLGYSFGAPLVPAIAAADRRIALAAMVYGGGDLHELIRHNVRRSESGVLSAFVGGLGALLLRPLEPLRHAGAVSPVPALMINGTEDEQIPRACTEALYAALREPKEIRWVDSRHVHPRNVELTRNIIALLREELEERGLIASR